MIIRHLAEQKVVPGGLGYDIACRVKFEEWAELQGGLPDDVLAALKQIMLFVPPFHASMHKLECREVNSLACEAFPGWLKPMGEPPEQLWAVLGSCARLKYMTLHHQKLYLEAQLGFLNQRCDARLADELLHRIEGGLRLQASLRAENVLFSNGQLSAESGARQVRSFSTYAHVYLQRHDLRGGCVQPLTTHHQLRMSAGD